MKKAERDIEKQVEIKIESVAADVESLNRAVDSAKSLAAEEQDKENRRCNIIMYRVPESPATSAEERGIDDKRFCVQFLTRLNMGLTDEDVNKVVRLRKRGQAPEPRPSYCSLVLKRQKTNHGVTIQNPTHGQQIQKHDNCTRYD